MSNRAGADELFGSKPNMTWDGIVKKYSDQGYVGNALYEEIIKASQRSNAAVNQNLGVYPK